MATSTLAKRTRFPLILDTSRQGFELEQTYSLRSIHCFLVNGEGDKTTAPRAAVSGRRRSEWSRPGSRTYATVVDDAAQGQPPKSPYPYPTHPSPSAHQIFHLPPGATQAQIKARYYELVRCHHPDSHHCRVLPPQVAHARFQSIVAAYDYLRGKASSHLPGARSYGWNGSQSNFDPYLHELARRRRAQQAAREEQSWYTGFAAPKGCQAEDYKEDGIKERTIFVLGIIALIIGVYPSFVLYPFQLDKNHKAAVVNLAQARSEAREFGSERRAEIRKRVQAMNKSAPEAPSATGESQGPAP
ncbi:hypothetical protein CC1G_03990 [Coprinopsis cinerea okayama7|uniref:J domain-containing protein n=1 Tax=Coprinopsis cinerea (strain Okayama-7 / 130 / ATCC MYA-4618 / FGSC 9003) TaxID=240176 RepID=A8N8E3_COPC7|nr:hypothetical protein CC1G_03990 [Coprinopsis cinerea okayama7\|eukprot:XP_001831099.2 hypothetical protein CC1G_03990 [Coprinopsis cinerea okayama7\